MGKWLRVYENDGRPELSLVCLPHAGGTASMFSSWYPLLPAGIELISVQYPGRHDRMTERYVEDVSLVADQVAAELREWRGRPIALFGHSVGAAIAYEVAIRLERDLESSPQHLFVSGRMAPHHGHGKTDQTLSDEDLVAEVRRFGGHGLEALEVRDLWPVILPPLRADLRMADRYRPASLKPLQIPVTAFVGDSDHMCPPAELASWRDATSVELDVQVMHGGHHYLTEQPERVVEAIVRRLCPTVPGAGRPEARSRGPSASLAQEVAELWHEHLDGREVGVDDEFFELGGNSLIGMRIIAGMAERYGTELSVRAFYLAQTPARVAELIEEGRAGS
ncbi:alpha/beta fold hydrolase [Salinispora mooreana]|uniref:alpha/beta fold hydrolase n=1 Tax=Salinispora mooreana TaxID=999545 RepID=UPI001CC5242D|nr:alpha/beta fold hydrolase [Salinispora mooreana]